MEGLDVDMCVYWGRENSSAIGHVWMTIRAEAHLAGMQCNAGMLTYKAAGAVLSANPGTDNSVTQRKGVWQGTSLADRRWQGLY